MAKRGKVEPKAKFVAYIPELGYDIPVRDEIHERTRITSEIASRLLELRSIDKTAPHLLMHKLVRVYRKDPFAMWLAVEVLAGDTFQAKSLSELGKEDKESKQATHHRQNRALFALESTFPAVAEALRSILSRQSDAGINEDDLKNTPYGP